MTKSRGCVAITGDDERVIDIRSRPHCSVSPSVPAWPLRLAFVSPTLSLFSFPPQGDSSALQNVFIFFVFSTSSFLISILDDYYSGVCLVPLFVCFSFFCLRWSLHPLSFSVPPLLPLAYVSPPTAVFISSARPKHRLVALTGPPKPIRAS
ncbi:hypothetical protein BDW67DRAFT_23801 [Aspergillus spinulosporus]